ncbi:Hypothetical protein MLEA_002070 [Mycoplasma leachii 99/014/6]|nr:Hypothetical protein MLEA_002070 [Mycoplasma leachii 99/014/6]
MYSWHLNLLILFIKVSFLLILVLRNVKNKKRTFKSSFLVLF